MNLNGVCLSMQRALSVSGSTESEDVGDGLFIYLMVAV